MATIAQTAPGASREERFFATMMCIMAATIVAGFSFNLAMGRSSFSLPLIYHVHAFVFFSWVALNVVQSLLVSRNAVALHRRLGWLSVGYIPVMVVLGTLIVFASLRRELPFFFSQNGFLFGNIAGLLCFAVIVVAAILMRRRTDWHRRLMMSGLAILTGPAFGRLLPMPLLIPWAWAAAVTVPMIFVLIGMAYDRRAGGRVHSAWIWVLAAVFGTQVIAHLIAFSPLGISVTEQVVQGTPGAQRSMAAFMPS